jgi:hypothetical protein
MVVLEKEALKLFKIKDNSRITINIG